MPRRLPPSPLKLVVPTPGEPLPRWPVFVVPSLPPPTFSAPVRNRSLSVGTGVVVGELPALGEAIKLKQAGEKA
ncbi:uncharacterized protein JCM6883_002148 [Sporobolomyces salmoneus]|uniref:uncharacterized protein n=1 Tax=Sporobolomyces salmoneus TaxID=183962 RepID=UPI003173BF29